MSPSSTAEKMVSVKQVTIPIVAVAAIASWTWLMATQFAGLKTEVASARADLSTRINDVHAALSQTISQARSDLALEVQAVNHKLEVQDIKLADRWTATDMKRFVADLARENPALKVPEIR